MPSVLITPEALIDRRGPWVDVLEAGGFDVLYPTDTTFTRGHFSESDTIKVLSVANAVLAGGEVFTEGVFAASPQLRAIARQGVGYDRVDIPAATSRKVPVTITPTANHDAVAEHAFGLLFGFAKDVVLNDAHTRAGRWPMKATKPVRERTLGILGLGRIGRSMALRGLGMQMNVIATEAYPNQEFVDQHGIELVDFDTLLGRSDFLSIHCPLSEQTTGLFNADVFGKMKQGSVLINTARGKIVVEAALLEALQSGQLAGAGLDVFDLDELFTGTSGTSSFANDCF